MAYNLTIKNRDGPVLHRPIARYKEKTLRKKALRGLAAAVLLFAVATFVGRGEAQDPPLLKVRPSAPHIVAKLIKQKKFHAGAARKRALRRYSKMVVANRRATWYWQEQALRKRSRTNHPERWMRNPTLLRQRALLWKRRAKQAYRYAINPPHKVQWLCIHSGIRNGVRVGSGEAAWTNPGLTWDGRPSSYHGGLQMDKGFMSTYAPAWLLKRGWAERWTPLQQMWVAERAEKSRGFHPWPRTAAACGYI